MNLNNWENAFSLRHIRPIIIKSATMRVLLINIIILTFAASNCNQIAFNITIIILTVGTFFLADASSLVLSLNKFHFCSLECKVLLIILKQWRPISACTYKGAGWYRSALFTLENQLQRLNAVFNINVICDENMILKSPL